MQARMSRSIWTIATLTLVVCGCGGPPDETMGDSSIIGDQHVTPRDDQGTPRDLAVPFDAVVDLSQWDQGNAVDASLSDSGLPNDAGVTTDGGAIMDAGAVMDGGTVLDSGSATDSGGGLTWPWSRSTALARCRERPV